MTRGLGIIVLTLHVSALVGAAESAPAIANYTRVSWTTNDGLPSNNVWAITQDRDGFLWLGTTAGLVRFDGARFIVWSPAGRPPLPPVFIPALRAANDGSIWIAFGGASRVGRIRNDQFVDYTSRDGLHEGSVLALLQSRDGTVWAGGRGGLSRFRNNRWEPLRGTLGSPEPTVEAFFEDRTGNLWVGTSSGVFRRVAGDSFQLVQPISAAAAYDFSQDRAGKIWVTDPQRGLRRLDREHPARPRDRLLGRASGLRLLHDSQGNLWVATLGNGLMRASERDGLIIERLTSNDGLAGDVVRSVFEDREGSIWVGTLNGLTRLSKARIISLSPGSRAKDESVGAIAVGADGSVWAGNGEGLVRFSGGRQTFYRLRDGLPSSIITALHADRRGTVWIGTDQGLTRYRNGRLWPMRSPGWAELKRIYAITSDPEGAVWISDYYNGLFRWKDRTLTPFNVVPGIAHSAYTDRSGRVWIGSLEGSVAIYDRGTFHRYSEHDGLAGGPVVGISEDSSGGVWVATSGGLSRFEHGRFVTLPQRRGLPGNRLIAFVLDEEDHAWLGVNSGIIRVDRHEFDKAVTDESYRVRYAFYDASDGLQGMPTMPGYPNAVRGHDGALWFVTASGLSLIDPRRLPDDRPPPAVRIEAAAADGHEIEPHAALVLPTGTSKVQIEYTAAAIGAPAKVHFRYLLGGFDREWQNDNSRRAFYTNLPPGKYRFQVSASYDDTVWSQPAAVWEFSIRPRFYQTSWFYGACLLTVALGLWTVWQLRVRAIRKQFSLVLAERARLGREIHDTLLQSLVGMALQLADISAGMDSSPGPTRERLHRIRRQVQHYIEEANQSIWDLRSPMLKGSDLAATLREAGENLAAGSGIPFRFLVTGSRRACSPAIHQQLLRIAQEAVTNALRHGRPRHIRMELCYLNGSVRLQVSDDGCGFDPGAVAHRPGAHWGLTIMQERARQIGGELNLVSSPSAGTTVEVIAPLSTKE